MAKVVLKNLSKCFGSLTAIHDMDLTIEEGEFMAVVGPSGCGKTTLLRLIAGLEEATSGEIWIDGKLVNDVAPKDREIAMVFQNHALYPHMSVYDNIAFGLKLRHLPRREIEGRVGRAAEILGIADKLKNKPKELSGGQRQRVALGRAIVREPNVFLFDEPLSNLDASLRVQMRAELQTLQRRLHTTSIYVTHDQVEAMTLGQRVAVLSQGVLQQVEAPQRLYDQPANLFVAGFIGSPSMNFLTAKLLKENRTLYLQGDGFRFVFPEGKASYVPEHMGSKVIVGIRPEDLKLERTAATTPSQDHLVVRVTVIEPLGSELVVHGELAGQRIAARLDREARVSLDQELTLIVNTSKIYLFDPASERSLLQP